MEVGDLVYDRSVCMHGIIVDTQRWRSIGKEELDLEHTILYTDGTIDTAYDGELWLENGEPV